MYYNENNLKTQLRTEDRKHMRKEFKEVRKFKVYEQSGHNYKPTPTITLKGLWLEELGFGAGTLLTVRCEEGKLVIEPRESVDYIDVFVEQQLSMVAEMKVRF